MFLTPTAGSQRHFDNVLLNTARQMRQLKMAYTSREPFKAQRPRHERGHLHYQIRGTLPRWENETTM